MVEKRVSIDEIKIRGKQSELRNMISYIEYLGIFKTMIKYAGYFVEINSFLLDTKHESLLSLCFKEVPDTPPTFIGSVIRFMLFIFIAEMSQRFTFKS
jgi:hypothetical protein